jgi:hypothetical protein
MMARITAAEAQAWVEGTKFTIQDPFRPQDLALLEQLEEEVLVRIAVAYPDQTLWVDSTTTPRIVRVIIAKMFVVWAYRRQYSEDMAEGDAAFAANLEANAGLLIQGIIDGTIEIPELPGEDVVGVAFYPTDASSLMEPTYEDPSLGPPKFSMGMIF